MSRVNLPVLALAVIWWLIETSYFGWHALPGSTPELFADGLALTLAAAAFLLTPKQGSTEERCANAEDAAAASPLLLTFESRLAKWEQAASLLDELGQPGMAMSARGFAIIERKVHEDRTSNVIPMRSSPAAGATPKETR